MPRGALTVQVLRMVVNVLFSTFKELTAPDSHLSPVLFVTEEFLEKENSRQKNGAKIAYLLTLILGTYERVPCVGKETWKAW